MRKLLLLLLLFTFSSETFSQVTKKDTAQRTKKGTTGEKKDITEVLKKPQLSYDSAIKILTTQQNKINSDINIIKANLDTIKTNTEPPSVLGEFITNKILDKLYDLLFGGEDKRGLIPFILSIIGLVLGFIRFLVLIIRFNKIEGKNLQKIQGIIIAFLLFITSALLFILTNRNFKSAETVKLDNLENKLASIHKEIQANQALLFRSPNTDNNTSALAAKFDKFTLEFQEVKKSIKDSEKNTAIKIDDKSTNGFWIFLNTILLIVIGVGLFLLIKRTS